MKLIVQLLLFISIFSLHWTKPICPLGIDLFNELIDEPYTAKEGFGVDKAIGIVSPDDPLPEHSLSKEEFEACMKKYFTEQTSPEISPFSPLLSYHQPSYLGKKPQDLEMPDPPSSYSIPKEGYTTYLHPYNFVINKEKNEQEKRPWLLDLSFEDWK